MRPSKPHSDPYRLLGASLLALFLCWALYSTLQNFPFPFHLSTTPSNITRVDDDIVDTVNSRSCRSGTRGHSLSCDPRAPTFYDDPTLPFSISTPISDWDRKRHQWLQRHPSFLENLEHRILVVSGSQPGPCPHPNGDHTIFRFFKNKVDYCRRHGYQIFLNQAVLNPSMSGCWAKIQMIRSAMMAHPESEWIFWIDSDAAFTDMDFKIPLHRYKESNLVVHGWAHLIYDEKSWVSINAGVFLIRNSQWGMDLLDEWAKQGPQTGHYEEWGNIQTSTLKNKPFPESDDQSALVYLLLKQRRRWGGKTYIENEYALHGYWIGIVDRLENITRRYEEVEARERKLRRRHAEVVSEHYGEVWEESLEGAGYGSDGWRRPFVTHFTGCQPCSGKHSSEYEGEKCWDGMKVALNFADNQVLRNYGFVHRSLREAEVVLDSTRFYDEDVF